LAVKKTSAEKRHRQSEERRFRNKAVRSSARTHVKKFVTAVHTKDQALASEILKILCKELDTAGRKGILSAHSVSRKKSRMMRLYNVSFVVAK